MNKNDIIRIINEELSTYDFLGNDDELKKQEDLALLKNIDFQRQFIIDSITKKDRVKIVGQDPIIMGGNWNGNNDNEGYFTLEYSIEVEYLYDSTKKPIKFGLNFGKQGEEQYNYYISGEYSDPSVGYSKSGEYDIEWANISVDIISSEGELIPFIALDKSDVKTQYNFVNKYIGNNVINHLKGI